jgi:hypothetical protein
MRVLTESASLGRKDVARLLQVSVVTVARQEGVLRLDEAKIVASQRTVRYSVAVLRRLDWFKKLEGG